MTDPTTRAAKIEAAARKFLAKVKECVESQSYIAKVNTASLYGWKHHGPEWGDERDALASALALPADPQPAMPVAEVLAGAVRSYVDYDGGDGKEQDRLFHAMNKALGNFDRAAAKAQEPTPHSKPGLYRCKVCGAWWELLSGSLDWTLRSQKCGRCCDNVAMGEQIEPEAPATVWTNKDLIPSFMEAARPLIKWLCEHMHPHAKVIVTPTDAELVTGEICTGPIHDYIKD